jgi:N6-adenosine-specific RNA methylase IME4
MSKGFFAIANKARAATGSGTVIIDPPWPYRVSSSEKHLQGGHSSKHYDSLDLKSLAALPITELGDYLFLWTTVAFVEHGYQLIRHWGFEPVTMLAWVKISALAASQNKILFAPNYGVGYWFRGAVEPILVAKKIKSPSIRSQWMGIISPNAKHSRKPKSLHDLIEAEFPQPYTELFAREQRSNWHCLGNEIDGKDIRIAIKNHLSR